ncbi:hypothetical protein EXIGLDRAFT_96756 [Exidia glandulosa HHB12029]|uniref:Uncharacterized protein n=1 Tax=Exidia glandulosa HHB12029 TaxID=1314781 RepID=A0A165H315_EXIGL|nr:hypothetical protein EXIGLDRAFT_96756 [Exidia glandulosa HHB12029]
MARRTRLEEIYYVCGTRVQLQGAEKTWNELLPNYSLRRRLVPRIQPRMTTLSPTSRPWLPTTMTSSAAALNETLLAQTLPIELFFDIVHNAAVLALPLDRTWAVSLARLSWDTYRLIRPALHFNLVITPHNVDRVARIWRDPSCRAVFNAVRRLVIPEALDPKWIDNDGKYTPFESDLLVGRFPFLEEVDAPFSIVEALAAVATFQPLRLAIRYRLYGTFHTVPNRAFLDTVTHIEGYWPSGGFSSTEWISTILAAVPLVTHVAFFFIDLQAEDRIGPDDTIEPHDSVDPRELDEVLGIVLGRERERIRCVAIRIAGERVHDWPIFTDVLRRHDASRVRVWLDEREMYTWDEADRLFIADAWAHRDIWTEAKPL